MPPFMVMLSDFDEDAIEGHRELNESLFIARVNGLQNNKRGKQHLELATRLLGKRQPGPAIGMNKAFSIGQGITNKGSKRKANLKKHAENFQAAEVECPSCDDVVLSSAFAEHIEKMHGVEGLKCPNCRTFFKEALAFCEHAETCGLHARLNALHDRLNSLHTANGLHRHDEPHSDQQLPCPRPDCESILTGSRSLKTHLKEHDARDSDKFKCEGCGKGCRNNAELDRHKRICNDNALSEPPADHGKKLEVQYEMMKLGLEHTAVEKGKRLANVMCTSKPESSMQWKTSTDLC